MNKKVPDFTTSQVHHFTTYFPSFMKPDPELVKQLARRCLIIFDHSADDYLSVKGETEIINSRGKPVSRSG
jgi:hypothetical protein